MGRPSETTYELRPIGVARTSVARVEDATIQARLSPAEPGRIVVHPEYRAALDGRSGFDFAWVVSLLHVADRRFEV